MKAICSSIVTLLALIIPVSASAAIASGLGVNVPVVGRVAGAGNTLFYTSLDVTNHVSTDVQVDFYFDGVSLGTPLSITGGVTNGGLGAQGSGTLRRQSNVHFEDFVAELVRAKFISQEAANNGVLGSVLFVFNGLTKSGQGSASARFANAFGGGTVGVALRGIEVTAEEPQQLVVAIRDTRGNSRGEAQLYPNLFINNIGLTPEGVGTSEAVTVEVSAVSNATGLAIGVPLTVTIPAGHTVAIGQAMNALKIPAGSEETVLIYARVLSGDAAIHGIVSQVDATTRDGSVIEMSRADF